MKKYARIIILLLAVSLYTQLLACGDTVDDGSESVTTETTALKPRSPISTTSANMILTVRISQC